MLFVTLPRAETPDFAGPDPSGRTAERAEALIAIAAPEFRDELTRQAKELRYL